MASEQGKRFTTDNQGIRDAIVGGLTYAITGGGPGTFEGLKIYQDKMIEMQEKLLEKMEKRMEKLQTLLMTRTADLAEVPTYTAEMTELSARVGDSDEGRSFMQMMYIQPSKSKEVLKHIREWEKSQDGLKLSPSGVLDIMRVIATGDKELLNSFKSNANILESVKGRAILDDELYYGAIQDALVKPKYSEGFVAIDYDPIPNIDSTRIKTQNEELETMFGQMFAADKLLSEEEIRERFNVSKYEFGIAYDVFKKDGITDASLRFYSPRVLENVFKSSSNPTFRNVFLTNPTYQRYLRDYFVPYKANIIDPKTGLPKFPQFINDINILSQGQQVVGGQTLDITPEDYERFEKKYNMPGTAQYFAEFF
jgi:hypothetical protein